MKIEFERTTATSKYTEASSLNVYALFKYIRRAFNVRLYKLLCTQARYRCRLQVLGRYISFYTQVGARLNIIFVCAYISLIPFWSLNPGCVRFASCLLAISPYLYAIYSADIYKHNTAIQLCEQQDFLLFGTLILYSSFAGC